MLVILEIVGIFAMVQGFGSAISIALGRDWTFMMGWAEPFQPVSGIALGIAGLAVALYSWKAEKRAKAEAAKQ